MQSPVKAYVALSFTTTVLLASACAIFTDSASVTNDPPKSDTPIDHGTNAEAPRLQGRTNNVPHFHKATLQPMVECKAIMLDDEHRAMDAWEQAKRNPNDFVRLVKEFSIEPISRAVGGDIPPIRRHVGSKKVVGEAFKLKPGEISGIIQTGSGRFVILLCVRHVEFW